MVVGDEVEGVALVLQRDVLLDRAEVVAEVQLPGRLDAAEDAGWYSPRLAPWAFLPDPDTLKLRPVRSSHTGEGMDTAPPDVGMPDSEAYVPGTPRTEHLLEALKFAIAKPGEHRLFRSGKLAGLFPNRAGSSAEAALLAIREGLLETVRTETRGKIVTEWVRATPKAVGFVHDHDSPKSVLRELKELLDATRAGVPAWMAEAKQELARPVDAIRGPRRGDHDATGCRRGPRRVRAASMPIFTSPRWPSR